MRRPDTYPVSKNIEDRRDPDSAEFARQKEIGRNVRRLQRKGGLSSLPEIGVIGRLDKGFAAASASKAKAKAKRTHDAAGRWIGK